MTKTKKALHIAKNVAWGIILSVFGIIALIALWLTIDKFIIKSPIPSVFGYATLTVETGSMAGEINPGDMVLIKDQNEYKSGDVITYLHDGDKVPTTHRIILVNEDGSFVTKGDANNSKDPEPVTKDIVYGKVIKVYAGAGVFSTWVRTEGWIYIIACLGILGLGLFIISANDEEKKDESESSEEKGDEPSLDSEKEEEPAFEEQVVAEEPQD